MAIKRISDLETYKIKIDLTGPKGNAFYLLGFAQKFAKKLGMDGEAILKDMQSADYEHLIEVFDSYFGDYVDLYR